MKNLKMRKPIGSKAYMVLVVLALALWLDKMLLDQEYKASLQVSLDRLY